MPLTPLQAERTLDSFDYTRKLISVTAVIRSLRTLVAPSIAISEAEALVMEVLWRASSPVSSEAVFDALRKQQKWQETTVKTLLGRLLRKGAIRADRDHRRYRDTPGRACHGDGPARLGVAGHCRTCRRG